MSLFDDVTKPGECCEHCKQEADQGAMELLDEALAKLPPASRFAMQPRKPLTRPNYQQLDIKVSGKQGDRATVRVQSRRLFKLLKKVAMDTAQSEGVRVLAWRIGVMNAFPYLHVPEDKVILTKDFTDSPLGCGIAWPAIQPEQWVEVDLEFKADCEFHAAFVGVAR